MTFWLFQGAKSVWVDIEFWKRKGGQNVTFIIRIVIISAKYHFKEIKYKKGHGLNQQQNLNMKSIYEI